MGKKLASEEELEARLEEFTTKIDALKAKTDTAEESSSKLAYHDKLEALVLKRDQVRSKLEELRKGTDEV